MACVRSRSGARMARCEERAYWAEVGDEQRRQPGCPPGTHVSDHASRRPAPCGKPVRGQSLTAGARWSGPGGRERMTNLARVAATAWMLALILYARPVAAQIDF